MAYLFITDGGPDAEDYDNNYFEYDKSDTETSRNIHYIQENYDTRNPKVRAKLIAICKASCYRPIVQKTSKRPIGWYRDLLSVLKWRPFTSDNN